MNIKWDADKYTTDFSFVHQYGNSVTGLDKYVFENTFFRY